MHKIIKLIAVAAVVLSVISCSGSGGTTNVEKTESTEEVVLKKIDVEGIMSLMNKNEMYTEAERDFLLDQYEVMIENSEAMPSDSDKDYLSTLDDDEQTAVFMVVMMLREESESMTEAQQKRFIELQERISK
ncbi:MAG: hypothetical protein K2M94_00455 [Paramuribaculum sp.]|nr:hypothetical protein [Paramuribaculum sp.]